MTGAEMVAEARKLKELYDYSNSVFPEIATPYSNVEHYTNVCFRILEECGATYEECHLIAGCMATLAIKEKK